MRTTTTAVDTALAAEVIRPCALVRLDFASGNVLVNSTASTITYSAEDYLGVGDLGAIDTIEEAGSVQPTGIKLTLSGIPPSYLSIALGDDYQGRDVKIYTALLDESHQLIADPVLVFQGRMDYMSIAMAETATITITAENHLANWNRPRVRRFNDKDQQDKYPGDKGFEFVEQMIETEILWGRV